MGFCKWIIVVNLFLVDTYYYKKESPENIKFDKANKEPLRLEGKLNFLALIGIVLSVAF